MVALKLMGSTCDSTLCLDSHINRRGRTLICSICTRRHKCRLRSRCTAKEQVCEAPLWLKGNRRRRLLKCPMGRTEWGGCKMLPRLSKHLARAVNAAFSKPMPRDNEGGEDFHFLQSRLMMLTNRACQPWFVRARQLAHLPSRPRAHSLDPFLDCLAFFGTNDCERKKEEPLLELPASPLQKILRRNHFGADA